MVTAPDFLNFLMTLRIVDGEIHKFIAIVC